MSSIHGPGLQGLDFRVFRVISFKRAVGYDKARHCKETKETNVESEFEHEARSGEMSQGEALAKRGETRRYSWGMCGEASGEAMRPEL